MCLRSRWKCWNKLFFNWYRRFSTRAMKRRHGMSRKRKVRLFWVTCMRRIFVPATSGQQLSVRNASGCGNDERNEEHSKKGQDIPSRQINHRHSRPSFLFLDANPGRDDRRRGQNQLAKRGERLNRRRFYAKENWNKYEGRVTSTQMLHQVVVWCVGTLNRKRPVAFETK